MVDILIACVHLGMISKVDLGSFDILYTKNCFPFLECQKWLFCEAPTKIYVAKMNHCDFQNYYIIFYG
jgi:hypothetical protein